MLISNNLIASSQQRLTFDPKKLSKQLDQRNPIDNEPSERVKTRLTVAASQGLDALERILVTNDLLPVNYLEKGIDVARAVGRIHKRDALSGDVSDYATGFLISPRLLLTNHHVLGSPDEAQLSEVEFNYQRNKNGGWAGSEFFALEPNTFFFTDDKLDFTVVAVAQAALQSGKALNTFGWLTLDPQIGKVSEGEFLTIVQHPSGEDKQIALRENQLLKIDTHTLWYRTDTAPGSSGSPVFNNIWQVVALHHSGVPEQDPAGNYLTLDGRASKELLDESKIKWIANEGIRVSQVVASLQATHSNHSLIQGIFAPSSVQVPSIVRSPSQPQELPMPSANPNSTNTQPVYAKNADCSDRLTYGRETKVSSHLHPNTNNSKIGITTDANTIRVNIPLTVTIELGGSSEVTVTSSVQPNKGRLEARPVIDYSDRQGYDPNFLGSSKYVELPELTKDMERDCAINRKAKPGTNEYVLPYHHFSIVMNKVRKMAFYTAVNIDGTNVVRLSRNDNWIADPRIGAGEQTDNSLYASNDLDRGHLVRRLDAVWGPRTIAQVANEDTFHFTNCSPQHKDFNQNDATWQGLENYILDNAIAEDFRVSVFTGPVFRDGDWKYRDVQLPQQFWKVIVMVKDGELSATAYLLSQEKLIRDFRDEVFSDDKLVKPYQVAVKAIEDLTGLSFRLSAFDPMERNESTSRAIPIASYKTIQL